MSVRIVRDTVSGVRPVFAKVFELFTGGFGWIARATNRHTEGVVLPAGSLLNINETTRVAYPIKRGRLTAQHATAATGLSVEHGHLFEVGESIHIGGTGSTILSITERALDDFITVGGGIASIQSPSGATVFAGTAGALSGTANAIAAYPTTIEAGASVSVIRRGTVYTNRIPPLAAIDTVPTGAIQFSDSQ